MKNNQSYVGKKINSISDQVDNLGQRIVSMDDRLNELAGA